MSAVLPASWAVVRLAEVLAEPLINGRSVPTAAEGFPVLRLTALRDGRVDLSERKTGAWSSQEAQRFLVRRGDFMVARGNGSRSLVGRGGLLTSEPDAVAFPDTLIRLRTRDDLVDPDYLRLVWDSTGVRDQIERAAKTTAGIYKINQQDLESLTLPLPPLTEQRRIVAALEEHLSDLDAGVAALARARGRLKRYTQAVYDSACAGSLLSGARVPETDGFMPAGWHRATPADLAAGEDYALAIGPFGSNLKVSDYRDTGVPLVFVRNIRSGYFGAEGARYVTSAKAAQLRPHQVRGGDILITKMGDPPGDVCLYPTDALPGIVTADCIKWTVDKSKADPHYLVCALRTSAARKGILAVTKGVAQLKVSLGRFRALELPLPPLREQREIAAEVDSRLVIVDRTAKEIDVQLARAARMRQAILKRAFEGRLILQDPSDEPASALPARAHDSAEVLPSSGRRSRGELSRSTSRRGRN